MQPVWQPQTEFLSDLRYKVPELCTFSFLLWYFWPAWKDYSQEEITATKFVGVKIKLPKPSDSIAKGKIYQLTFTNILFSKSSFRRKLLTHFYSAPFSSNKWNLVVLPETPHVHYMVDFELIWDCCAFRNILVLTTFSPPSYSVMWPPN